MNRAERRWVGDQFRGSRAQRLCIGFSEEEPGVWVVRVCEVADGHDYACKGRHGLRWEVFRAAERGECAVCLDVAERWEINVGEHEGVCRCCITEATIEAWALRTRETVDGAREKRNA